MFPVNFVIFQFKHSNFNLNRYDFFSFENFANAQQKWVKVNVYFLKSLMYDKQWKCTSYFWHHYSTIFVAPFPSNTKRA